jgi:phage shock protein C
MYCSHCGKEMDSAARFCPGCGATTQPPVVGGGPVFGQLTRPRYPRAIGGVCSGLALHYGWDITTVRLLWALCVIFAGTGIVAYIIAWIVIPEAPYELPEKSTGSGV